MMISPNQYVNEHKEDSYEEQIRERDRMIREVKRLEKIVFENPKTSKEWCIMPSPDVQYQMDLEYLASLCLNMKDVFRNQRNEEE